jgi:hypothetical protein
MRYPAALMTLKHLGLALAWLAVAEPVAAQELDELIRARVEQLTDTGVLAGRFAPRPDRRCL